MYACLGTFNLELSYQDFQNLFDFLNTGGSNKDSLDEADFIDNLFSNGFDIVQPHHIEQISSVGDMNQTLFSDENSPGKKSERMRAIIAVHPKFYKRPLERDEMMDYPYFWKMKMGCLNLNTHKMVANKPKRTLSIVSSDDLKSVMSPNPKTADTLS